MNKKAADAAKLYGNRFLVEDAPDKEFPANGMSALDAMRMVDEELVLEGDPWRNLATFVTTWMEPEAQRIVSENLHRNFIDHAEYPISAQIEHRCVRMLVDRCQHRHPGPGHAELHATEQALDVGRGGHAWSLAPFWNESRSAIR